MIRSLSIVIVSLASFAWSLPACDSPEARKQLVTTWDRMAKTKGGELVGSTVKVWNLRQDGKAGECRADFLAIGKNSRIGGSLPFAASLDASGRLKLKGRGEPTLNLLQADSVPPGARPTR
ncbi:MAG: hypothetical protein AAB214_02490 [Fibrobacterota bacterium]